jgi:PHD/YefM family antitoxin component YafN of YafNO toxin-antitoxin module
VKQGVGFKTQRGKEKDRGRFLVLSGCYCLLEYVRYNVRYKLFYGRHTVDAISATNFRKNLFSLLSETIRYNTPFHITTKEGSAVVLSEDDYNALQETLFISSVPGLRDSIIKGMNTSVEDCKPLDLETW